MMNDIDKIIGIHELVEKQALLRSDAFAVAYQNEIITYAQLNKRANQLAHLLKSKNVNSEILIGIILPRSIDMIIAVLAVLKAGYAYVPIDIDYPHERINYILADTNLKFLITQKSFSKEFPPEFYQKIIFFDIEESLNEPANNLNITITLKNMAYLLYTSGSTGKPKGVMVSHSALMSVYSSWEEIYKLKNTDNHLQMANFSFDVFTGDWVRALCSGAKLVICPKTTLLDMSKLYELMCFENINIAEFVPTVVRHLIAI